METHRDYRIETERLHGRDRFITFLYVNGYFVDWYASKRKKLAIAKGEKHVRELKKQ